MVMCLRSGAAITLLAACAMIAVSCDHSVGSSEQAQKRRDQEFERLVAAAKEGKLSAVETALVAGADPNHLDAQGGSPLEYAAASGNISVVKALLANGASVRGASPDGYTALHAAAVEKNVAIVELLLAAGADVNAKTTNGVSPLLASVGSPYTSSDVSLTLISHGADVNIADSEGRTPLLTAISDSSPRVVEELLKKGANPNAQSESIGYPGYTPLHMAALSGSTEDVELLLRYGADPTIRNAEGQTALDVTHVKFEQVRKMLSKALQGRGQS
jgi:ankyrin repeat protein